MVVEANVSLRQRRTKLDDLLTYNGPLADSEQEEYVALMESEAVGSQIRITPPGLWCSLSVLALVSCSAIRCYIWRNKCAGIPHPESLPACMQVTHCQRWQTAMAVLSFTLATLMIVAGVRQLLHPWDLKHHAFFNGETSACSLHFTFATQLTYMSQLTPQGGVKSQYIVRHLGV